MKKTILLCMFLILIIFTLAACSSNTSDSPYDEAAYASDEAAYTSMPLFFASEEELILAIKQQEGKEYDAMNLTKLTEFYKPGKLLPDIVFNEIAVKQEYVMYIFSTATVEQYATFTWSREMSPEVAMNDLTRRGVSYCREVEHNELRYVFLGYADPKTQEDVACSVHWVQDGKPFTVSISHGYSDEEILAFCDFTVVPVK